MQKWEYQVKRLDMDREPSELADALNALGDDGWELVTVVLVIGVHAAAVLKRPVA